MKTCYQLQPSYKDAIKSRRLPAKHQFIKMRSQASRSDSAYMSDCDITAELDNILQCYEDAALKETHLINALPFHLKSTNLTSIYCGLSPARNFDAVVMIANRLDMSCNISLTSYDWNQFIDNLNQMYQQLISKDVDDRNIVYGNAIKLSMFTYGNGYRAVSVSKNDTNFFFTIPDVWELLQMTWIIQQRLNVLINMNFSNCYDNFLSGVNDLINKVNIYDVNDAISTYCDFSPLSVDSYCIRECLYYYRNKVLNDLDRYSSSNIL
jgi:hypothetical protein